MKRNPKAEPPREEKSESPVPPVDAGPSGDEQPLGQISPGPRDRDLGAPPPAPAATPPAVQLENEEPLALPTGALVAMRKSGGLKFSSRSIVLLADGTGTYWIHRAGEEARTVPVKITKAELARVKKLLAEKDLWKPPRRGKPSPDAFAYEVVGIQKKTPVRVETWDGNVPRALRPLVDFLTSLMPE